MKRFSLTIASFLLICVLIYPSFAQTLPCRRGNTRNTAYMQRRNDKRCEGITTRNVVDPDFGLRSFSIGKLPNNSNFSLTIPKLSSLPEPHLRIQSDQDYFYQLDPLELKAAKNHWEFRWPNTILKREEIPLSSLRSLAEAGSERVLLPVRFSPSSAYDFRIHTGNRTKTITLKILNHQGTPIYIATKADQPGTGVSFSWDGRTTKNTMADPGRYTLRVEAQIERANAPAVRRSDTRKFEHNPTWLQ